jgi:hypothetical protein
MCSGTGASTCSRKSPRLPPGLLPPGAPPSGTLVPLHPPACARLSEDGTRLGRPVRSCLCAVLGAQLALGRPGRRDPLPAGLSELRAHWRRSGCCPIAAGTRLLGHAGKARGYIDVAAAVIARQVVLEARASN